MIETMQRTKTLMTTGTAPPWIAACYLLLFDESLAQRFAVLSAHLGLVVGAVTVDELAYDDFSGHGKADFIGRHSVPDFTLLFVVLHGLEAIAQLTGASASLCPWLVKESRQKKRKLRRVLPVGTPESKGRRGTRRH